MRNTELSMINGKTPEYVVHNYHQMNRFYDLQAARARAEIVRIQSEAAYHRMRGWKELLPGLSLIILAVGFLMAVGMSMGS